MLKDNLKWEVARRLEEIEMCLYWKGHVQRANLIDVFGISPQQASADFAHYQEIAPENMLFNGSLKRYEPTERFTPVLVSPEVDAYCRWAEGVSPVTAKIPIPARTIDMRVVKPLVNALHNQLSVEIAYQSMSSPEPSVRRLSPHTLVNDGYRYHVRGYCHKRQDYRDFVLGRISDVREEGEGRGVKSEDEKWNTLIPLIIVPHPGLTKAQQDIIQGDYGMVGGRLVIKVRQALVLYVLAQLRLDRFSEDRSPAEQQIVLLNADVLGLLAES